MILAPASGVQVENRLRLTTFFSNNACLKPLFNLLGLLSAVSIHKWGPSRTMHVWNLCLTFSGYSVRVPPAGEVLVENRPGWQRFSNSVCLKPVFNLLGLFSAGSTRRWVGLTTFFSSSVCLKLVFKPFGFLDFHYISRTSQLIITRISYMVTVPTSSLSTKIKSNLLHQMYRTLKFELTVILSIGDEREMELHEYITYGPPF